MKKGIREILAVRSGTSPLTLLKAVGQRDPVLGNLFAHCISTVHTAPVHPQNVRGDCLMTLKSIPLFDEMAFGDISVFIVRTAQPCNFISMVVPHSSLDTVIL